MKWNMPRITKRWISSVFGVILIILSGFELTLGAVIFSYYHNSAETFLKNRADNITGYYNSYIATAVTSLDAGARRVAEEFSDLSAMEIQVLDTNGTCLYTSIGYAIGHEQLTTSDFKSALVGVTATYTGRNAGTDEQIMAVSSPLLDAEGQTVGVLRLVSSLEAVDRQAWIVIGTTVAICVGIVLFVFMTNYYFISSIVSPLSVISDTANRIAQGDMSARIENTYKDEVGDLCNSINNMAGELAENERMKNDFISSVSHELRTPLTAIKGWSETLTLCDPAQDRDTLTRGLTVVNDEVSRLSHMVEELLDFSRIQSGRMRLHLEPIDLYAEITQVTLIMREHALKAGIDILFDLPEDASAILTADPDRLSQVFINIIDNAIKHSESGSQIRIYVTEDEKYHRVYVEDEGEGIREEDLPKIKERFYKGVSSKRGTGLGLAVADEIMHLHGGDLFIDSILGEGTKVTILMPKENKQ